MVDSMVTTAGGRASINFLKALCNYFVKFEKDCLLFDRIWMIANPPIMYLLSGQSIFKIILLDWSGLPMIANQPKYQPNTTQIIFKII